MSASGSEVEHTTAMALEEKAKLQKSLRRFDMLFFTICALVGVDTLGQVSGYGAQTFTWLIFLAIFFLLPYALVMSEIGAAFHMEGGPYEWMKLAWGRLPAGIGSVLYWITNPLWVGGTLCFTATAAWATYIHPIGSQTFGDYLFKVVFIWISIGVAIAALRRGKWIPNVGAIVRMGVLGLFSLTVVIYAIEHGVHGYGPGDFKPSTLVFLGLVPLLLFNYVGFELQNGAAEEMVNPQHDVPVTVIQSGVITVLCYGIPIFGILAVLPTSKITGISGFLTAVDTTFSVYGSAAHFMVQVMALGFILALITSGAVWMIGSDRIQAVAAYDGAAPGFFGVFNAKLGTPVRVNVLSGIMSTIFMIAAQKLSTGSNADTFVVVLYMATTTTLLSYLLIFPAVLKLRYSHPHVNRPYVHPGGIGWLWVSTILCTGWMVLGSWVAVFPGTIEAALTWLHNHIWSGIPAVDYGSFTSVWGISRARFEVFTLGTLAVILVLAVLGYMLGAPVRSRQADVSLETSVEPATGD
jgi:glutamate:GABA antiporter